MKEVREVQDRNLNQLDTKKETKAKSLSKKRSLSKSKEKEGKTPSHTQRIGQIQEKINTLLEKIERIELARSHSLSTQENNLASSPVPRSITNPTKSTTPSESSNTPTKESKLSNGSLPTESRLHTKDVLTEEKHTWEEYGLNKEVLMGIQKKGFNWPSPVQAECIPHSLAGRNIVARAKNGTGKTGAFVIPLLQKVSAAKPYLQALVLVPTRELVLQTVKVCKELGHFTKLKMFPLYGGVSAKDDVIRLKNGAHVIVGTPGRVLDFVSQGVICLDQCRLLVCDEADKLLGREFCEVLCQISEMLPAKRQIEMYSATFPHTVQEYIDGYMQNPVKINLMKELALKGVKHYYAYVKPADKLHCLKTLLNRIDLNQCFIFCNSINTVEKLAKRITELGFVSYFIHSRMKQEDRNLVFHNFSTKGECRILVSTDLVTRGIDVPSVNVVINFDLPWSTESYLHRIGRSGRFGTEGMAINMVTPGEADKIAGIEADLGIEVQPFSGKV
ncbi:ATP-dependent RNA helicase DDX6/DHH1 [Nematocida homosporus]|uniref:ATP-dependent RNA helicase DDX6/DHH1 n=1 Tax=Nematocida homosporus TaxID=1912981 RepID=UPI00221F91CF|nr:ATP-dependent RNA helicase DDX6/DHH1 [Nematocida homosporus]KAI5187555.1 ATP-dependent RNA helicase DDX6/DHH1 [Nematocida homosporus]